MTTRDFIQVDVFTDTPLRGNPAAVVYDAQGLTAETMQAIAREMNLSETVFLLPPTAPGADYRARIFSPGEEFPFAGHPTLAAAFAVLDRSRPAPAGAAPEVLRQECGIGVVPVRIADGPRGRTFTMTQGRPEHRACGLDRGTLAAMLGCAAADLGPGTAEVVSTGLPWLVAEVAGQPVLSALRPDLGLIARISGELGTPGITVFCENPPGSPARLRLRTFAPRVGVAEDPVCGSGNGAVAAWLARHRDGARPGFAYVAEQGVEIGRGGRVQVATEPAGDSWAIHVGGAAVKVIAGRIEL